jgi:hypothetical protein
LEPRVGIAHIEVRAADGTFTIGRETFPDFDRYARLGVHVEESAGHAGPSEDFALAFEAGVSGG